MGRMMEILVSVSAIAGIATFLGFRAMARKAVRSLGRKPKAQRTYRTTSGKVLTDDDVQSLADEAERGYDVEHLNERRTTR